MYVVSGAVLQVPTETKYHGGLLTPYPSSVDEKKTTSLSVDFQWFS